MKRAFDFVVSGAALIVLGPFLAVVAISILLYDRNSPFYVGRRVALGGGSFGMVKFRSMSVNADRSGVMSTAGDDPRITPVGRVIRALKVDELPQLWNIVRGDMSFVGPRPNVATEVALYSAEERRVLDVRPGITDLASIVFADEGDILHGSEDPDREYNLLIRPWKSRLGLHYVENRSLRMDLELIALTAMGIVSRRAALAGVQRILERTGAAPGLIEVARRDSALVPSLPPGVTEGEWERHLTYPES